MNSGGKSSNLNFSILSTLKNWGFMNQNLQVLCKRIKESIILALFKFSNSWQ